MISKKDRYKRFISFISALVLLGLLVGIFAYFWYKYYSDSIVLPYKKTFTRKKRLSDYTLINIVVR